MLTKIIAQLIYYFIRLLNLTYRFKFIGLEHKYNAKATHPQKTFIFASWHQHLISAIFSHIGEQFTMVISESKDGELVAVTCEKFGHRPARGSSTRGGKKALMEIVRNMKMGYPGAITVDGPKGPPHIVKPGVIEVARICKCAILPFSFSVDKSWVIKKSWDQFIIPKPFSKIIVVIGEPIYISDDISRDKFNEIALYIGEKIEEGGKIADSYLAK